MSESHPGILQRSLDCSQAGPPWQFLPPLIPSDGRWDDFCPPRKLFLTPSEKTSGCAAKLGHDGGFRHL
jgi:hypothetical protein